jgi:hypothetical protein
VTSQVTRDDIEALLWRAGIRSRNAIDGILKAVDKYAVTVYRRDAALTRKDIPCDAFYYLAPGEWDKDSEVTRCDRCGKPKSWYPHFHLDKSHPSRHKVTCKACLRKADDIPVAVRNAGGWKCPDCGERKFPAEFPEAKRKQPRRPIPCTDCSP